MAHLLEVVAAIDELDEADRIAVVVQIILVVRYPAVRFVVGIIRIDVVDIIADPVIGPVHVSARIGDIEVTDLPLDGQRILGKFVVGRLFAKPLGFQVP